MSARYEFLLKFWGEICNDGLAARLLGSEACEFWFDTTAARDAKKRELQALAKHHRKIIAFAEEEGTHVRLRTIARMNLLLPDGRSIPYTRDYGFGYPPDAARWQLEEGNFACDCNRGIALDNLGIEFELPHDKLCGDSIGLSDLVITQEAP